MNQAASREGADFFHQTIIFPTCYLQSGSKGMRHSRVSFTADEFSALAIPSAIVLEFPPEIVLNIVLAIAQAISIGIPPQIAPAGIALPVALGIAPVIPQDISLAILPGIALTIRVVIAGEEYEQSSNI